MVDQNLVNNTCCHAEHLSTTYSGENVRALLQTNGLKLPRSTAAGSLRICLFMQIKRSLPGTWTAVVHDGAEKLWEGESISQGEISGARVLS